MSDDRQVPVLRAFSVAHHPAAAPTQEADEWAAFYEIQHQQYGQLVELSDEITHHKLTDRSTAGAWVLRATNYLTQHALLQQQQDTLPYSQGCIALELAADVAYTHRMTQAAWAMHGIVTKRDARAEQAAHLSQLTTTETLTPSAVACIDALNTPQQATAPPDTTGPPRGLVPRSVLSRCAAAAAPPFAPCTHHERLLSTA